MPANALLSATARTPATKNGVTLVLTFPGRRYHATPWGHHVNEGLIEWPPSPWRLLRALLSTGYCKLHWPKDGPPEVARSLIEKLATALPRYRLPTAAGTHSRHYMPMARFKNGREETTMVLDTWAQVDDGEIAVHWPVTLTLAERDLLSDLARDLGYLGRSESWVEGAIADGSDPELFDVTPGEARDRPGLNWEQVPLLAPVSAKDYARWREQNVEAAVSRIPEVNAKGRPLKKSERDKELQKAQEAFPRDLIACLQVGTAWLQELGWNQPPGARKVFYWRPARSLEGAGPQLRPRPVPTRPVDLILLSLASSSGNSHALPAVARTLPQGDLLHRALLSAAKGRAPSVLSGRDTDGNPMRGERAHCHAHLMHLDLDGDDHLDHALLWAPMGFDASAQHAVRAVRRTYTKGGTDPLRLAISAMGSRIDLAALPEPWGQRIRALLGHGRGGSRRWSSLTPFVPPRFMKPKGSNTLEGQIRAELSVRGLPDPILIHCLDPHTNDEARKARHFVRRRSRRGSENRTSFEPPVDCGFMLELEFAEKVIGPIALGYASHFGLGVFTSTDDALRNAASERPPEGS